MAYKSSPRGTRPVRLVVLHTTEGAMTAASLGAYFYRDDVQASSHVGIGRDGTKQYVPYSRAAWTIRSGNPISDNAELCGYAHWTRTEWLTNQRTTLDLAAAWLRDRCRARGIPCRKLNPSEVAAGRAGVIGHWDWTVGMRDGTHTDPGSQFPWDYVIKRATEGADIEGDDMATPAETWGYHRADDPKDASQHLVDAAADAQVAAHRAEAYVDAKISDVLAVVRTHTDQLNKIATALAKLTGETA